MDCQDYITGTAERKKGQHLQREERGAIQHLKCQGYTNRAIAREIGCSPSTVANELRRGTPPRKSNKGRKPGYVLATLKSTTKNRTGGKIEEEKEKKENGKEGTQIYSGIQGTDGGAI